MIDMRVRKHDSIDLLDGIWEPQVLRSAITAFPLKQTAVEKYCLACDPQDVTRAGDLPAAPTNSISTLLLEETVIRLLAIRA